MSVSPMPAASTATRRRSRRWIGAAGAAGAAFALALAGAPAADAAEPWGFEQVTPVNKGAGSVNPSDTFQTAPDGNGFLLSATSEFAGVPAESVPLYTRYFASRGANGWSNRAMDPLTNHTPPNYVSTVMSLLLASSDVSHVLVASTLALTSGATPDGGNLYVRSTATGEYTLVATHEDIAFTRLFFANQGNLLAKYVADDGRSALFASVVPLVPGAPDGRPDGGQTYALYSWTAEEGVRIESVLPDSEGGEMVPVVTGVGGEADFGIRNPLPAGNDGLDYVYFSVRRDPQDPRGDRGPVYVRSGGETRAVSVSRIPGADSEPVGATLLATGRGGRFMLFATAYTTPLTSDTPTDVGADNFLYRYDAVEDSLTYVGARSTTPRSVWQMSQDGRTVAFVSRLGLVPGIPAFDTSNPGGDENVYVWRDGVLRFVARGDALSDAASGNGLRVLSSNGRYLAFTDNATGPLSAAEVAGVDLGSATARCPLYGISQGAPAVCNQVFVYDADTDVLECASCRTDGLAPKDEAGDAGVDGESMIRMGHRQVQTVADDGTAFFTTAEDLVPGDVNGLNDVYAYRDGEHRLLSRASQGMKARFLDATPDGKSVFFATNDPIAPTDNDKAIDIYMTREGAGFPYTPPIVVPPCTGGDCREPFTPVEGLPLAGSVSFAGRGNSGPAPARLSVAGGKSIVGTAAKLRVRVPGKGRVTVSGAGVKTAKRSVSRAGTYTVRVALTAKARKALKRSKSARKRVRVTFTPAEGSTSNRTLSLTYRSKPANKKKGR
jgi:hypothetical protein